MYVRKFRDLKERRKKCFVLIDLKVCTLTHQDIGQMDIYVRYLNSQNRSGKMYKIEGDKENNGISLTNKIDKKEEIAPPETCIF